MKNEAIAATDTEGTIAIIIPKATPFPMDSIGIRPLSIGRISHEHMRRVLRKDPKSPSTEAPWAVDSPSAPAKPPVMPVIERTTTPIMLVHSAMSGVIEREPSFRTMLHNSNDIRIRPVRTCPHSTSGIVWLYHISEKTIYQSSMHGFGKTAIAAG